MDTQPWPFWMTRFIISGSEAAFNDLIWSVGGSPPYGGVSYDEASAIFEILDRYRGSRLVPEEYYIKAKSLIKDRPKDVLLLSIFQLDERFKANEENISETDVLAGLKLCEQYGDPLLFNFFEGYYAGIQSKLGNIELAKSLTFNSLKNFIEAAQNDENYLEPFHRISQNYLVFQILDGDISQVRTVIQSAGNLFPPGLLETIEKFAGPAPVFPNSLDSVIEQASNLLESGHPVQAIEWSLKAEQMALDAKKEPLLCGILGDLAVAFRRVGNPFKAIKTYERVIDLCRKYKDYLHLSKWQGNLAILYLDRNDTEKGRLNLEESMDAAALSGDEEQVKINSGNYVSYLYRSERYYEGIQKLESLILSTPDNVFLQKLWKENLFNLCIAFARQMRDQNQLDQALKMYQKALQYGDVSDHNQAEQSLVVYAEMIILFEKKGNLKQSEQLLTDALQFVQDHTLENSKAAQQIFNLKNAVAKYKNKIPDSISALPSGEYRSLIKEAVKEKDKEKELTARVNLCMALLNEESGDVQTQFDETERLVKSLGDKRRQMILYLSFSDYFLQNGHKEVALKMAQDALSISADNEQDKHFIALLNLGDIWIRGFNEADEAIRNYRLAVEVDGNSKTKVIQNIARSNPALNSRIARAAKMALDFGDARLAIDLCKIIGMTVPEEVPPSETKVDLVSRLKASKIPSLEPILAIWRAACQNMQVKAGAHAGFFKKMEEILTILGWEEALPTLKRIGQDTTFEAPPADGDAAGLLELSSMLSVGSISYEEAVQIATSLHIADQDLVLLTFFTFEDPEWKAKQVTFGFWRIAVHVVADPVVAARLYNLLGMYTRDIGQKNNYNLLGAQGLPDGVNDRLKAKLFNESASGFISLNQFEEAIDKAQKSRMLSIKAGDEVLASMAEGNIAFAYMQQRKFDLAIPIFESLLIKQEKLGNAKGLQNTRYNLNLCYQLTGEGRDILQETDKEDPDYHFSEGIRLGLLKAFSDAIAQFEQGFKLIEDNGMRSDNLGAVHQNFAKLLFDAGEQDRAIGEMKKSADFYQSVGNEYDFYKAYQWLASVNAQISQSGLYYAKKALELGKTIGTPSDQAADLDNLGRAYIGRNQAEEAIPLFEAALSLINDPILSVNLASAFLEANQVDKAIQLYQKIEQEAEKTGDLKNTILAKIGLGKGFRKISQTGKAISCAEAAYQLAKTAKDANLLLQAILELSYLKQALGQPRESLELLDRYVEQNLFPTGTHESFRLGIRFAEVLKDMGELLEAENILTGLLETTRKTSNKSHLALVLSNLGNVYSSSQQNDKAMHCFLDASELSREINDTDLEAACTDTIGTLFSKQGKFESAIPYHSLAFDLHQKLENPRDSLIDLLNLITAYYQIEDKRSASDALRKYEEILFKYPKAGIAWEISFAKSMVKVLSGNWQDGKKDIQNAIAEIEKQRASIFNPDQQKKWSADKSGLYKFAAHHAIIHKDGAAAIEFLEYGKARFLQALKNTKINRPPNVPKNIWNHFQDLKKLRAQLKANYSKRLSETYSSETDELRRVEQEYQSTRLSIKQMTYEPLEREETPVFAVETNLFDPLPSNTAVIYMTFLSVPRNSGLGCVVVIKNEKNEINISTQINKELDGQWLRQLVYGNTESIVKAAQSGHLESLLFNDLGWTSIRFSEFKANQQDIILETCKKLGRRLWPSVLALLPDTVNRLILVPSQDLNMLPLHAAQLPDNRWLDEKYQVGYIVSLNLYNRITQYPPVPKKASLGQVINPTSDLPYTYLEGQSIRQNSANQTVYLLEGKDAKEAKIVELLQKCDVFHFAGHGFYDSTDPLQSGLVLSGSPKKGDTVLSTQDLLEQTGSINSRMVILSACETGITDETDSSEDFIGLPGAVQIGGAKMVLASMWKVDDKATALLLGQFYKNWQIHQMHPFLALAQSQQWLRNLDRNDVNDQLSTIRNAFSRGERDALSIKEGASSDASDKFPYGNPLYWAPFYLSGVDL